MKRDLFGCPYVSGENADVCLPPKLCCPDNVICARTQLHMHIGAVVHTVACQHFHTLKFQSESKQSVRHTFCPVRNFHTLTEMLLWQIIYCCLVPNTTLTFLIVFVYV